METRANHLLIGSVVLVALAGVFAFAIWLAKVELDREFDYYETYFTGSVTGLTVGGDVRFNGIPVGAVDLLQIDPDNPRRVRALLSVQQGTPIRTDTLATLEFQGITGVVYVQLSGGSAAAPMLKETTPEGQLPIIASRRSSIQELFEGAPELIARGLVLLESLNAFAGPENQRNFSTLLANASELSGRLAGRADEIERVIVNADRMAADLQATVAQLNRLVGRLGQVAEGADATLSVARGAIGAVDQTVEEIARTAQSIDRLTREFETLVSDNREPIEVFASQGLVEFTRFIEEARLLVASATRFVEELQANPAQFLLGRQKGVEAER
jgi:phospholipid/cholesterol/gamma-HCH transport system substrate-binding protein